MKIRAGFMMREVAGKFVAVPVGAGVGDFKGMLQTNKIGAFLWKLLQPRILWWKRCLSIMR